MKPVTLVKLTEDEEVRAFDDARRWWPDQSEPDDHPGIRVLWSMQGRALINHRQLTDLLAYIDWALDFYIKDLAGLSQAGSGQIVDMLVESRDEAIRDFNALRAVAVEALAMATPTERWPIDA